MVEHTYPIPKWMIIQRITSMKKVVNGDQKKTCIKGSYLLIDQKDVKMGDLIWFFQTQAYSNA